MESATQTAIEHFQTYGTGPIPIENDPLPEDVDFASGAGMIVEIVADMFSDNAMEMHLEDVLWGMVNAFDRKVKRCGTQIDDLQVRTKDAIRNQDGSEVQSVELEQLTAKAEALTHHMTVLEDMRDRMCSGFAAATGSVWKPYSGTRPKGKTVTSAIIDARDFKRARDLKAIRDHVPDGTLIAVAGGPDYQDIDTIHRTLDATRKKYPDMVLVHGGQLKGAEMIASKWADRNGVTQLVFKPDFKRWARRAPFKRNEDMANLEMQGAIIFPGNGITMNFRDLVLKNDITVHQVSES